MNSTTGFVQINKDIDYSNLDDITASINACALDIENLPGTKSTQASDELESVSKQPKMISQLELPVAPSTTSEEASNNLCFFKTKSGGYKAYELSVSESAINFNRPKSTKQQELSYELSKVQCLIKHTQISESTIDNKNCNITGEFCINLITSNSQQRSIYFDSEATMMHWHKEILSAQGYYEQRINQYEPLGKLGEGTFGVVILSQHKNSGVKVAVKVIQKGTIDKVYKKNKQHFEELEISKKIARSGCKNILELVEVFEDSVAYYVVTKFMPTGDLYNYICQQPNQPLDEEHTKVIIRQLCQAVKSLHSQNIIHRDIKIENILMSDNTREATLKLADLGSAAQLESSESTTTFQIGTPGYLAPEVLLGKAYNFSCDIWSIGALMTVLLSAKLPFFEEDRKERKRRVCTEPLDLEACEYMSSLSQPAKDLVTGMLTKDPAQRLTIEQILAHEWLN